MVFRVLPRGVIYEFLKLRAPRNNESDLRECNREFFRINRSNGFIRRQNGIIRCVVHKKLVNYTTQLKIYTTLPK